VEKAACDKSHALDCEISEYYCISPFAGTQELGNGIEYVLEMFFTYSASGLSRRETESRGRRCEEQWQWNYSFVINFGNHQPLVRENLDELTGKLTCVYIMFIASLNQRAVLNTRLRTVNTWA